MTTRKQRTAAKRNIKNAAKAARRKRTIAHLSRKTRTALRKEGARAARNQGVGKALMARAASIAREASAEEMIWSVYQPNTIAATFYEKLGAQRITDVFFMKLSADKI